MARRSQRKRTKGGGRSMAGHQRRKLEQQVRELYAGASESSDWAAGLEADDAPPSRPASSSGSSPKPAAKDSEQPTRQGVVVALGSAICAVESDGEVIDCVLPSRFARQQRSHLAVGDEVRFAKHDDAYRLTTIEPRRTVLSRPDPHNPREERLIAANVDVVVQVSSVRDPAFSVALVDRFLIASERGGAEALLVVNKSDLLSEDPAREQQRRAELDESLEPYRQLGLTVILCSAKDPASLQPLRAALTGRTAVFAGHSGVGKSSLLNALAPEFAAATGTISEAWSKGRHTTTRSRLHHLAGDIRLIDTPGIRELGLWQLERQQLGSYFEDLQSYASGCRFGNCSHVHEPQCAVLAAVAQGQISQARYATYRRILASLQ